MQHKGLEVFRIEPSNAGGAVMIVRWSVYEIETFGVCLVGHVLCDGGPRLTSPVMSWDHKRRVATTRSGREYVLIGPPGKDEDAEHLASVRVLAWAGKARRKIHVLDRSAEINRLLAPEL
jgi:hypothetical protein